MADYCAIDYYKQLEDYVEALRAYIIEATCVDPERLIFAPPDVAKTKLRTKLAKSAGKPVDDKAIVVDNFISFFFPYSYTVAEERMNPMQKVYGAESGATHKHGYMFNTDLPVQIDIWGAGQEGKSFMFNSHSRLTQHILKFGRVYVPFDISALNYKDINDPEKPFDVNVWYNLLDNGATDNSNIENMFTEGIQLRSTFDMTWMISFYSLAPDADAVGIIEQIILEYTDPISGETNIEWIVPLTSTTTSSSTSTSTSSSTSTTSTTTL